MERPCLLHRLLETCVTQQEERAGRLEPRGGGWPGSSALACTNRQFDPDRDAPARPALARGEPRLRVQAALQGCRRVGHQPAHPVPGGRRLRGTAGRRGHEVADGQVVYGTAIESATSCPVGLTPSARSARRMAIRSAMRGTCSPRSRDPPRPGWPTCCGRLRTARRRCGESPEAARPSCPPNSPHSLRTRSPSGRRYTTPADVTRNPTSSRRMRRPHVRTGETDQSKTAGSPHAIRPEKNRGSIMRAATAE